MMEKYPVPSLRGPRLKGERRRQKDLLRAEKGVSEEQRKRDATPHCHYPESTARAYRNKGRQRFKTGKKSQKH